MAVRVNTENFEQEVLNSDKLVLTDFYSDSCIPCKRLSPVLSELEKEYGDSLKVVKVNINFDSVLMEKYEVHIIGHGIRVQECADRFVSLGFKIHNITPKSVSFIRSCKEMEAIFRNEQFDIVHSHLTEWACVPMFLAWKCGVKN